MEKEICDAYWDEASLNLCVDERLIACQSPEEFNVGGNPDDVVLVQGFAKDAKSLSPVTTMHNHLGNHRVVENANGASLIEPLLQAKCGRNSDFGAIRRRQRRG